MKPILYKGYLIEEDNDPWANKYSGPIRYWMQDGGIVHSADSVEEAKDLIMQKMFVFQPKHEVLLHNGKVYPFDWIEDAIKFASKWNGSLLRVENI